MSQAQSSRWAAGRSLQFRACLRTAQHTKQVAGICSQASFSLQKNGFFKNSLWPLLWGREESGIGPQLTLYFHNKQKMPSTLMSFLSLLCLKNHIFLTFLWQTKDSRHSARAYTHSCFPWPSPCWFLGNNSSRKRRVVSPNVHSSLWPSEHGQPACLLLPLSPWRKGNLFSPMTTYYILAPDQKF